MRAMRAHNLSDFVTLITSRDATEVFVHTALNNNYGQPNTVTTEYEALIKIGGHQHLLKYSMRPSEVPEGWSITEDDTATMVVQNKPDFVAQLMALGVSADKMKVLKSAKVSELKQVFDNTPVDENADYEEIAVRFTKKGDNHSFKIPTWKNVKAEITDAQYSGGLNYKLTVDVSKQIQEAQAEVMRELKKTKLPVFNGSIGC